MHRDYHYDHLIFEKEKVRISPLNYHGHLIYPLNYKTRHFTSRALHIGWITPPESTRSGWRQRKPATTTIRQRRKTACIRRRQRWQQHTRWKAASPPHPLPQPCLTHRCWQVGRPSNATSPRGSTSPPRASASKSRRWYGAAWTYRRGAASRDLRRWSRSSHEGGDEPASVS